MPDKEYWKKYYSENKDRWQKYYLENKYKTKHCEQCNVDVCHSHWARHLNTKKHKKNSTINILPNIGTE